MNWSTRVAVELVFHSDQAGTVQYSTARITRHTASIY